MENNKEELKQFAETLKQNTTNKELVEGVCDFVDRKQIIKLKEDVNKETNIFSLKLTRTIIKVTGNKAIKVIATMEENDSNLQKEWIKLSKLMKEKIKESKTIIDERIKELEDEKI